MTDLLVNIKKNVYELVSAILFIALFYFKNKLMHDYFSYQGFFQSIRFKILKIEKLAQLLVLSGSDRAVLYELIGDYFIPTAFSLRDGISFQHSERIPKASGFFNWYQALEEGGAEIYNDLPVSSLNTCKSIQYSLIKNQEGRPKAILMLHFVFQSEGTSHLALLKQYKLKLKDILYMQKEDSKKLLAVLISFLTRLVELITIKNILRIALMALNIRIIQFELSREGYTFVTLPIYGLPTEIPLVLLLFFAALANSGLLEGFLFLYTKLFTPKTGRRA